MRDAAAQYRKKTRFIVELRYGVIPELFDMRGQILSAINPKVEKTLTTWQVGEDRILFLDDAKAPTSEFLISSQRISIVSEDPPSLTEYIDTASRLLGLVYTHIGPYLKKIDRLGVRFLEITKANEGSHEAVVANMLERFHKNPVPLPLEYTDSQVVLVHKYGRYAIGPAKRGEEWAKQVFKKPEENVPPIGISLDIDSYGQDFSVRSSDDLQEALMGVVKMTTSTEEALLRGAGVMNG